MKLNPIALSIFLALFTPPTLLASNNGASEDKLPNAVKLFHEGNYDKATEELKNILSEGPPSSEASYLLGMSYKNTGKRDEAINWLKKSARHKPLADYSLFYLAETHLSAGDDQAVLNALQNLLSRFPESRWKEDAGLKVSEILFRLGRYSEARSSLERFIRENPKSALIPKARINIAESLEKEGRPRDAYNYYKTIWLSHPASPESMAALQRMGDISAKEGVPPISADERFNRACNLLTDNYYRDGINELLPLLKDAEKGGKRPQWYTEALLKLGNAYYQIREDEKAASVIKGLLETSPSPKISEEALFIYGKAVQRLGKRAEAASAFETIAKDYPKGEYAPAAIYRLADMAEDDGNTARAGELYRTLYTSFPANGLADDSLWKEGLLSYLGKDYQGASLSLTKLMAGYPSSEFLDTAAYWSGRVAEKIGNREEAVRHYMDVINRFPLSYYAVLSKMRLSETAPLNPLFKTVAFTPLRQEKTKEGYTSFHLEKGKTLLLLGFREDASTELSLAAARCDNKEALMEISGLLAKNGEYHKAQRIAMKLLKEDAGQSKQEALPLAFPLAFSEDISANAERNSLNPYLIHALIREESSYRSDAVSRAGAVGLMQVMPSTGDTLWKKAGITDFSAQSLYKPDVNITLGTLYLKKLIEDNKGNLPLAIASYNAGPEVVSVWISRYGTDEMDEFIERIPYFETRNYVKRVMRSYEVYQRLYGAEPLLKEAAK